MILHRLSLALSSLVLFSLPAQGDTFLDGLVGDWSGGGWARGNLDAPREAVRCRLSFASSERTGAISVTGKCAGGGAQSRVTANMTSLGNGRYRAGWSASGRKLDNMSGRRVGNGLSFRWSHEAEKTAVIANGDFSLIRSGATLTLKTRQTSPGSGELGELQLRRR